MKALSLWQPWASLIAIGAKTFETRSWSTDYRGPLLIHAAKNTEYLNMPLPSLFSAMLRDAGHKWESLPLGRVVAICDLVDIYPTELVRERISQWELTFGDYADGRYAWKLANVRPLHSPVIPGRQGLFEIDPAEWPALETELMQQLRMF